MKLGMVLLLLSAGSVSALTIQQTAQVQRLIQAYPTFLAGVKDGQLLWQDGTLMPIAASGANSYVTMLDHPGLLDQLSLSYPACQALTVPAHNVDPGRARFEPLFRKMYGGSAAEVQKKLEPLDWFGQTVQVTRVNGVAASLRQVAREVATQPELLPYVRPSAGTFFWRTVAGTPRLSVHSFGAAIDLNVKVSAYWKWDGYAEGQRGVRYRNQMPAALVHIFERNGWIWGGRWYHYDTMHFEYRPELAHCSDPLP